MHLTNSGTAQSRRIGLIAILVVWISSPLSVPAVKILLGNFSPEELLFVRSACGLLGAIIIGGKFWQSDWRIKLAGVFLGLSSITFYKAIQVWNVNPVIVLITFSPAVNIAIAMAEGRKVRSSVFASMACIGCGIVLALDPWKQDLSIPGLLWSVSCSVLSGLGLELWSRGPEQSTVSEKQFWLTVPLLLISAIMIWFTKPSLGLERYCDWHTIKLLAVVGVVNGIIYINASIVPFSSFGKMNTPIAAVLLQATSAWMIVVNYFLLGETLPQFYQKVGVILAIAGTMAISLQSNELPKPNS